MYKNTPQYRAPAMENWRPRFAPQRIHLCRRRIQLGHAPGLKNLHRSFSGGMFGSCAIGQLSAGRLAGARSNSLWHGILSEMGMVVISSTLTVGSIAHTLSPAGSPWGKRTSTGQGISPIRMISHGGLRRQIISAHIRPPPFSDRGSVCLADKFVSRASQCNITLVRLQPGVSGLPLSSS